MAGATPGDLRVTLRRVYENKTKVKGKLRKKDESLSLGIVDSATRGCPTGSVGTTSRLPPDSRPGSQTPSHYDAYPPKSVKTARRSSMSPTEARASSKNSRRLTSISSSFRKRSKPWSSESARSRLHPTSLEQNPLIDTAARHLTRSRISFCVSSCSRTAILERGRLACHPS
jgi:hypothetical protein